MLKGLIEFSGKTPANVEYAIQEALKRILVGNFMGYDQNADGHFWFELNGKESVKKKKND